MEDKKTVPVISDEAYGGVDYINRSNVPPPRVTAYALDTDRLNSTVLLSLWVDRPGQSAPSCVVLSLPATHQIGKALLQAVRGDYLGAEATEELP